MRTCENVGELARELRGKTKMPLQAARMKLTEINQLLGGGHQLHLAQGGVCPLGSIAVAFVYRFNHDRLLFNRNTADQVLFDLNLARITVHRSRDREEQNEECGDREDFATPFESFLQTDDACEFSRARGINTGVRS